MNALNFLILLNDENIKLYNVGSEYFVMYNGHHVSVIKVNTTIQHILDNMRPRLNTKSDKSIIYESFYKKINNVARKEKLKKLTNMKTRNGFVSNSSSSSFIVSDKGDFKTVQDVAKYIIDTIKFEWDSNYYAYNNELKNLLNMSNKDTPVYFNTGDETYIRKIDDKIIICTTQNVSFDKIIDNALNADEISQDFYEQFDFIDEYQENVKFEEPSDFRYFYPKFDDFLILKYNFLGRHSYIDNCPHCKRFSKGWLLKGGRKICECQIEQAIRKEKLNKIKENEN